MFLSPEILDMFAAAVDRATLKFVVESSEKSRRILAHYVPKAEPEAVDQGGA